MEINDYRVQDFVCDHSFQEYCLGFDTESSVFWEKWIAENPDKASVVLEAKRLVNMLSAGQGNKNEQLKQLKEGLTVSDLFIRQFGETDHRLQRKQQRKNRHLNAGSIAKIAIPVAACLLVFMLIRQYMPSPAPFHQDGPTVYHAGAQGKKTIQLDDGSLVTLREHSTLTVYNDFNTSNRTVALSGEAYFDVAKDQHIPFIVNTKMTAIKVLGTIFNVKEYPEEGISETTLIRGKVEVTSNSNPSKKVTLLPNQKYVDTTPENRGTIQAGLQDIEATPKASGQNANFIAETAWVTKRLDIANQPLGEIASSLEDWYGIPIIFEDEQVKEYTYTGIFQNESVTATLEALQLSYPFQFKIENERIIISKD